MKKHRVENLMRGAMLRTLFYGEDMKTATENAKSVARQLNTKYRRPTKADLDAMSKLGRVINILNSK